MKNTITLLFVLSFLAINAQNDNPYALFGYKGNTIKTPKERMNNMLLIQNTDTVSSVKYIGIEPKNKEYFLFDKNDNVISQGSLTKEQVARFFSVDPLAKNYPHNSVYAFAENDVTRAIDLEGLEKLIVSNINKEDRTATLTIKKTALMVKEGLDNVPQHGKFSSKSLNSLFKRGNRRLFFKDLPQNGIESQFVVRKDWKKGSAYKIDVEYDVDMKFVSATEAKKLLKSDPVLYSMVRLGKKTSFTDPMNPAKASTGGRRNKIFLSPTFFGTSPTGPIGTVGEKVYPNATELLGHELGIHNMAGHSHPKDKKAKAAEYQKVGLKGSVPGSIYPIKSETQQIINTNKNNIEIKE